MIDKKITDFFNKEYLQYVNYVIEDRAIPNIIDGMKSSYRKSLYSAIGFMKNGVSVNGLEIVGETYKKSHYHHGNASIEAVITNQGATYSTNSPVLVVNGSGGDLRNTKASSIRYLKFTLSEFIGLYNIDLNILEHNYDGDVKIEPNYYLPLIPMVLSSRDSGMAIAYSFDNSMSYSIPSLIDATICELNNIKNKTNNSYKLEPLVYGYEGTFIEQERYKWKTISDYTIKGGKITITGLPISETYEKFENRLRNLIIKGTILSFDNDSTDDYIRYVVYMNNSDVVRLTKKNNIRLEKMLGISSVTNSNVYTFIDENGKVLTNIKTPIDVVKYFTAYRLTRFKDRKKILVSDIKAKILVLSNLSKFINLVITGEIELRNRPIKEIKTRLSLEKLPHNVLDTKLTKLTKEECDNILNEINSLNNELERISKLDIVDMYMIDLLEIKDKYKKYSTRNKIVWLEK